LDKSTIKTDLTIATNGGLIPIDLAVGLDDDRAALVEDYIEYSAASAGFYVLHDAIDAMS
jgi:hypothetical protein